MRSHRPNRVRRPIGLALLAASGFWVLSAAAQPWSRPVLTGPAGPSPSWLDLLSLPSPVAENVPLLRPAGLRLRVDPSYGRQPLPSERNEGQVNRQVKFLSRGRGYTLYLTPDKAVLTLPVCRRVGAGGCASGGPVRQRDRSDWIADRERSVSTQRAPEVRVLRLRLIGAQRAVAVAAEDELRGKVNYFIGNDPAQWHTNIPTYARVRLEQVYPGIDLVYYSRAGRLEYDFRVAPGADPNAIGLEFAGADRLRVESDGDLAVTVGDREVRWCRPQVYQEVGGRRREIAGIYRIGSETGPDGSAAVPSIRFQLADYDPTQALVIDPTIVYSTYLGGGAGGGSIDDSVITADRQGNAYFTGRTSATDFPTKNAMQDSYAGGGHDAVITKLGPDGRAIYSTYLGGSDEDGARAIAVDQTGSAYVTGDTKSDDFPTVNAFQKTFVGTGDAFVAKLRPDGAGLVYSTYLGGSGGSAGGRGIAVDDAGEAVVGGGAEGGFPMQKALYPTYSGAYDCFLAKLTASGSDLIYSTYIGSSVNDGVRDVALDKGGNVYVCGDTGTWTYGPSTLSVTDFPIRNAVQSKFGGGIWDGFVCKISPDGQQLLFSTFLGGPDYDRVWGLALAPNGDVCILLNTSWPYLPMANNRFHSSEPAKPAVVRMKPDGSSIIFSTYIGGSGNELAGGSPRTRTGIST